MTVQNKTKDEPGQVYAAKTYFLYKISNPRV